MIHSGTLKVTYKSANNRTVSAVLVECCWTKVRGVAVIKGYQSINGRLVKRTIAGSEIVPNGIRYMRAKSTKGQTR